MRELLELLDIEGCIITADAPRCRKRTAKAVIKGKGDYVLNMKDNQPMLNEEIADYVQDIQLRDTTGSRTMCEKTSGMVERRTAYTTRDIDWFYGRTGLGETGLHRRGEYALYRQERNKRRATLLHLQPRLDGEGTAEVRAFR
jgi:hypothetical protein